VVCRRTLDEGDPAGKPPLAGVVPAARDVRTADVDTGSVRPGRGFQNAQQQFTPAAAVVDNRLRPGSGQFSGDPVSAPGGKRSVKRQTGA
jgi:hypothetical protein